MTIALSIILFSSSYIFLKDATRGFVGLNENIFDAFLAEAPEILIIFIALFCTFDAEEKIVSNFIFFLLIFVSRETQCLFIHRSKKIFVRLTLFKFV